MAQYIFIDDYNNKFYFKDKEMRIYHREDGPACEYTTGTKVWYKNGLLHREDGPAFDSYTGNKEWWVNGDRHREDGPAIECADLYKQWYLSGVKLSKEEFLKKTAKEIVLTMDEIADKLGIDVNKLKIKK
jgi:hypothetical protein